MLNKAKSFGSTIANYPKTAIAIVIALSASCYWGYTRLPSATGCAYEAMVKQSVPWELWRFNFMADECQYFNGTRWIPLQKVMDVGGGGEVEDMEM